MICTPSKGVQKIDFAKILIVYFYISKDCSKELALSAILDPVEVCGVPAAELWGQISGACWEQDF